MLGWEGSPSYDVDGFCHQPPSMAFVEEGGGGGKCRWVYGYMAGGSGNWLGGGGGRWRDVILHHPHLLRW